MASPSQSGDVNTTDGEQANHKADSQPPPTDSDKKASHINECRFLRLPAEIRLRIYEYVLLPEPSVRLPCAEKLNPAWRFRIQPSALSDPCQHQTGSLHRGRDREIDSPDALNMDEATSRPATVLCQGRRKLVEGRFVGSTCEAELSIIRPFGDTWRRVTKTRVGATHILVTNRHIFNEAAPVLYEPCRVCVREGGWGKKVKPINVLKSLPAYAVSHIRHFSLDVDLSGYGQYGSILQSPRVVTSYLPNVRTFSIHIDVDLCQGSLLDAAQFQELYQLADQIKFRFDIHISRDWSNDGSGWEEPIEPQSMEDGMVVDYCNRKAQELRDEFVETLSNYFALIHDKKLRIAEE